MLTTKDLHTLFEEYSHDFTSFSREDQKKLFTRCLCHHEYYRLKTKLKFTLEKEDYKEIFLEFSVPTFHSYTFRDYIYYTNPIFLEILLENKEEFEREKHNGVIIDMERIKKGFKNVGFHEKYLHYYEEFKLIPSEKEYKALNSKNRMMYRLLIQSQFSKSILYGTRNSFWRNAINMINIYGVKGYEEAYRLALKTIDFKTLVHNFTYMFIFPITIFDKDRADQFMKLYAERIGTMRNTKNAIRHFDTYHNRNVMYRVYKNDIMDLIKEEAKNSKKIRKALKELNI